MDSMGLKKFFIRKDNAYWQAGFTITESLLYMGLLIILITILSSVFSSILDVQLESKSTSSVELDGRYILSRLMYDMHKMQTDAPVNDAITTPSGPGITSSTLSFKVNSINYSYGLNNGDLELVNNNGTKKLNSSLTSVSGLQFTRIGAGSNMDTIQVSFTVTSKINRNSGPESRSYRTTIGLQ